MGLIIVRKGPFKKYVTLFLTVGMKSSVAVSCQKLH